MRRASLTIGLALLCSGCAMRPIVHQVPGWQPVQVTIHAPLYRVVSATKEVFKGESIELVEEFDQSSPPMRIIIAKDHARPQREVASKLLMPLTGSWLEFVLECHFISTPDGAAVTLSPAIGTRRIGMTGYTDLMPTVRENWPYQHAEAMAHRIQQFAEAQDQVLPPHIEDGVRQ